MIFKNDKIVFDWTIAKNGFVIFEKKSATLKIQKSWKCAETEGFGISLEPISMQ